MMFVSFIMIAMLVSISLWGWGILCQRLTNHSVQNWVVTIMLGLGAFIFCAGILNLLRIAYGWSLDVLLLTGIVLAIKYGRFRPGLPRAENERLCLLIIFLPVALILSLTTATQLSPDVFNPHDDFEKYFAFPVRMLQTGTLSGSTLNALGSETLGAEAVLHAVILNHFPVQYINSADAVFGLLLCLLLPVSIFPLRAQFSPMFLIGPLMVFFINPQYVNVSSLYVASACVMTLIIISSGVPPYESGEKIETLPSAVFTGLLYAALIASKSHFLIFVLLHLLSFIIMIKIFNVELRQLIRWVITTVGMTLLFLLPWIFLYIPNYIQSSFASAPLQSGMVIIHEQSMNILSASPLYYGASIAHYTFLCTATLAAVVGIALWKRRPISIATAGLMACAMAVACFYFLLVFLGPVISGYKSAIRYTTPVLIAGAPVIFSIIYLTAFRDEARKFKKSIIAIPILLGIFVMLSFSSSLLDRIHQWYNINSNLSYLSGSDRNSGDFRYSQEVLYGDTRSRVIAAQKCVPPGQAIVAWISTPFQLDYRRNAIYDAERSGIATPWTRLPEVDYFLFEYSGPAVRTLEEYLKPIPGKREQYISERNILFLEFFQKLRKTSEVICDDGRIVVLKKRRAETR